ncbi:MAG TPA: DUF3068 domain-containing protein [Actinomycetales bacterium]|nr:DUF3068 domain-containing protein [Actinomycetales bacterium]
MARKTLSHLMLIIGAALVVIAVLLPTFLVPKFKVIPLDTVSTSVTETREGTLLDASQLAAGEPVAPRADDERCQDEENLPLHCFINDEVPLFTSRHIHVEEPSDEDWVTLQAGLVMGREDKEEPDNLVTATLDRVTLDRRTSLPVNEPISTFSLSAPGQEGSDDPVEFTRPGVQYKFPFDAEKKSYQYFDGNALQAFPIDFMREEEQDGETVYVYEQSIGPVNLYESVRDHFTQDGGELTEAEESSLASLRLAFPAENWGLEGDEEVEMSRYYTNTRTLRIEPTTGQIVNGTEQIFQFYAQDDEEAEEIASEEGREREAQELNRTAMRYDAQWDEDTMATQMGSAKDSKGMLNMAGTIAPWVVGIIGVILIALGLITYRRA